MRIADKLDPEYFRTELLATADILHRLDKMPKELLAAGDSSVYR